MLGGEYDVLGMQECWWFEVKAHKKQASIFPVLSFRASVSLDGCLGNFELLHHMGSVLKGCFLGVCSWMLLSLL